MTTREIDREKEKRIVPAPGQRASARSFALREKIKIDGVLLGLRDRACEGRAWGGCRCARYGMVRVWCGVRARCESERVWCCRKIKKESFARLGPKAGRGEAKACMEKKSNKKALDETKTTGRLRRRAFVEAGGTEQDDDTWASERLVRWDGRAVRE